MTFRIDEFRANINAVGGLASPSKFGVFISPPSFMSGVASSYDTYADSDLAVALNEGTNLADARTLSMLCDTVNLPGMSLQLFEYRPQGFGKISKIPFEVHYDSLTATFMLDNDHRVLNFLQYWMQEIVNTGSDFSGDSSTFKNRTAYEFNYKKNYSTSMSIQFYSNGNEDSYIEYVFQDVYPMQIGSIELGWENNDQIAKVSVEFSYSSYTTFKDSLSGIGTYATRGVDYYQPSARYNNLLSALTDTSYGVRNMVESFTSIF